MQIMELPSSASVPLGPSSSVRKREAASKADAAESDDFVSGFTSSDDTGGDFFGTTKPKRGAASSEEELADDEPASEEEGIRQRRKRDTSQPVCGLCLDGGDLLCCEGRCYRSFHRECLGFTDEEV